MIQSYVEWDVKHYHAYIFMFSRPVCLMAVNRDKSRASNNTAEHLTYLTCLPWPTIGLLTSVANVVFVGYICSLSVILPIVSVVLSWFPFTWKVKKSQTFVDVQW